MIIPINEHIKLTNFNKEDATHLKIYEEFENGESNSKFISKIGDRLLVSRQTNFLEFSNAYLILYDDNIVGYLYLTAKSKVGEYIYLEMSILKEYRKKHLGRNLLEEITNYIYYENDNLKEIRFSIDRSNVPSMKIAQTCGFYSDDEDYTQEKIDFSKANPYYISRGK